MECVTITKGDYETLLRRAESNSSSKPHGQGDPATVTIKSSEYADLVRQSSQYRKLRQALLESGVTLEAINIIITENGGGRDPLMQNTADWADDHVPLDPVSANIPMDTNQLPASLAYLGNPDASRAGNENDMGMTGKPRVPISSRNHTSTDDGGMVPVGLGFLDEDENRPWNEAAQRPTSRQHHTLAFCNLPDGATLKDIIKVIKGGRLVEIYLRRQEHKAIVTFMDGAADFLAYAKRNDIYIGSKRLEISWSDRQFKIASHLSVKLAHGATRNIIVRGAAQKVDEADVREHLDHIHNLIIVGITWIGADAVISTNSVNNAMFARTCMKSRAVYKGLSIEWYPDECEAPLPKPVAIRSRVPSSQTQVSKSPVANRFNLLDDGKSDGKSDGDSDLATEDGNSGSAGVALSPRSQATTVVL